MRATFRVQLRSVVSPVSQDFRQIAERNEQGRSDRLFRGAISAFCALTRPSRREIAQLEALCLQLYDNVSEESRRYVAAVLSELPEVPSDLVRRLADESIEIAAPLLLKSPGLAEIDLIAIIGRHGASHARVIAQRKGLTERTTTLLQKAGATLPPPPAERVKMEPGQRAEQTRRALRGMMLPAGDKAKAAQRTEPSLTPYEKLRATALTGSNTFFQTALADALGIEFKQARALTLMPDPAGLARALKALGLSPEQGYLIVSAIRPMHFGHSAAIRSFVERYERISAEEAVELVRLLQADAVYSGIKAATEASANANARQQKPARRKLSAA